MADIQQTIADIADAFEGEISLAARDLRTGRTVERAPARRCPTASVIKLPILVHVLLLEHEGLLSLDTPVVLRDADRTPGSGILTQLSAGLTLPLRDACVLMIALSDNTATNLVLDRVGIEPVNERMAALGLRDTRLFRKVFATGTPTCEENRRYGLGMTTPRDMMKLLTMIHAGHPELGGMATCARIRDILARQQYREAIPRYLPSDCKFAGKSGAIDAVRNDVGFVTSSDGGDIALAIFCQKMPRPLWTADNPGHLAIGRLARALVDHFCAATAEARQDTGTPGQ